MACNRSYKKKRSTRRGRRKFNISRPMRPRQPMVSVVRTTYAGNWTFGTATTNDFWRYVTIDMTSFNNFTEMAAIFDEYRVNAIKVTYRPAYDNVAGALAASAVTQPQAFAHYIVDPGSTVIPSGTYNITSLNTLLEQGGVKTRTLNKPFSIYYKPQVLDQVFNTGTASVMRKSPWVRTSDTAVSYRGYHMYLQQNGFNTGNINIKLDTYITMYVQFRNIK